MSAGRIKQACCRIGWHARGRRLKRVGDSDRYRCSNCGAVGLVDSQGNLFATGQRARG